MQNNEERNFVLRPTPDQKFRPNAVLPMIKEVVTDKLSATTYNFDEAEDLSKELSSTIRNRLKGLQLPRYKYIVQVYLAEQAGQGMATATQSVWDEDCDSYVNYRFTNTSIWCQVLVHAIFHY
ncbi:unnamed protein product [Caenorhabditis angaria]|uniref:Uncharacterized protein n=1 Tax=Caenorhabditis angaria TaxID=860376 RepID=A0A9P1J0X3_9PELO|nr:unnamed protein product [Caenorhabditis angaria]